MAGGYAMRGGPLLHAVADGTRQAGHGPDQLAGIDRLAEVGVIARVEDLPLVLRARPRGERQGGSVTTLLPPAGANGSDERDPILAGHRDVAHDDVGREPAEDAERFLHRGRDL